MKVRTEQEIEDFIYQTWDWDKPDPNKARGWRDKTYDPHIHVYENTVRITLSGMYEPPGFTFKQMMAIAEFFETDNVKDVDRSSSGGCETCDYGSVCEFTIEIGPGEWPIRPQG